MDQPAQQGQSGHIPQRRKLRLRVFLQMILVTWLVTGCARPEPEPVQGGPDPTALAALVTYPKFGDGDPHDWTGRTPRSYPIHGIDISRWQGEIDWPQARRSGVTFAFIKATEGGDVADPKFKSYWQGARSAGVRRGAYHYFYFCRPAAEQARWFIKHVPRDASALPHVLDMEWNPRSPTCRIKPDGAKVRAEAIRFVDIIEAHYGRRPVIYTTVDFYRETGIGKLGNQEFWLRSVAGHPSQVYPGADWTFWQYSGTGLVPGIDGQVDLNVFRAAPENWLRWAR